jgi:Flp pilus assembly pilin Flp
VKSLDPSRGSKLTVTSFFGRQRGQGMTEYIIIVALIAVAAIGVYSLLGQTIRNQTAGIAQEIAGVDGSAAINAAGSSAATAQTNAAKAKGLATYSEENRPAAAAK